MKFKVSKTFAEVSEESEEHGSFSDSGFIYEDEILTLRELIDDMKDSGCIESSGHPISAGNWFSTDYYEDYQTGINRQESFHITRLDDSRLNLRDTLRIAKLARIE